MKPIGRGQRVLVVEDEALIAFDLERRLTRAGFEVVGRADDRDSALELAAARLPQLVLMDISLRGSVDGIETAKQLGGLLDAPVVFLTAYADDETVRRAAEISPYGYLVKPIDDRALLATVSVALTRSAADTRARLLAAAVEATSTGIALVDARDPERRIFLANRAFSALTQDQGASAVGQRPWFLDQRGDDPAAQGLRDAVARLTPAEGVVSGTTPAGQAFWASVAVSPLPDRAGQISHLVLLQADLTRQHLAELALAESQRLEVVGRLAAGVAHDVNNVLASIVAFGHFARRGLEEGPRRDDLDQVLSAAQRGTQLTRRLLDFSRRRDDAPSGNVDVARVLRESRPMLERLAGPRVELQLQMPEREAPVATDETSIEQICMNLVTNARDAMPDGGRVVLSGRSVAADAGAAQPGERFVLEVTDTGVGMDAATLARIFDPLFTTKKRGLGTGLGLSTTRTLVDQLRGRISVRSNLGAGTTFTVELPLAAGGASPRPAGTTDAPLGHAGGACCLLVDDEPELRAACRRALVEVGFEVVEAGTGEAALQALDARGDQVRLVVCDLVLPGLGGAEVLGHARRVAPGAAALAITGYFDPRMEPLPAGVELLWKPFEVNQLSARALQVALGRAAAAKDQRP